MSVSGLGYLGISATDIEAWRDLAVSVFSMEVIEKSEEQAFYLRLDDWHHRLTITSSDSDAVSYVGWEVQNEESLDSLAQRLNDYGVKTALGEAEQVSDRKVTKLYNFIDPASGFPSEIFFGPKLEMHPFSPARGIAGYRTEECGLGHVVYFVEDYAGSVQFYRDVLGFRVSDYIIWDEGEDHFDVTFFHCNPRHHSLAVMPPFGPFKGGDFNHLMLESRSIDDVGYAYDIVQDKGIPVMMGMGKHTNDHTQSFYIVTPSGFGIEYGANSRLVGDDWAVKTYDAPAMWGHRAPG